MKMKLFNIFLASAAMASLVACTSDDSVADGNNAAEQATSEAYQSLLTSSDQTINVGFGTGKSNGVASKGSIPSTSEGYFKTDAGSIGIFMLAMKQNTVTGDPTSLPIDWAKHGTVSSSTTKTQDETFVDFWYQFYKDKTDVWSVFYDMDNVACHAQLVPGNVTGTYSSSKLVWEDGKERYYPMGNYHTYGFFAYSPRQTSITYAATQLSTTIKNLDGTKDVITGYATSSTFHSRNFDSTDNPSPQDLNEEGAAYCMTHPARLSELEGMAYSAKFCRQNENRDPNNDSLAYPVPLEFKHKLIKLSFYITPGYEKLNQVGKNDYSLACETHVDSIAVVDAPSSVNLIIADRTTVTNSGTISIPSTDGRNTIYYLKDSINAASGLPDHINGVPDQPWRGAYPKMMADGETPDTILVGQGIMVPPITAAQETAKPYRLMMIVSAKNSEGVTRKHRIIYPMRLSTSDLKQGQNRKYILSIYKPETTGFKATLKDWETGTETEGLVVSLDMQ